MSTQDRQLKKSVSFFGLVALGLGGVWGTSWLILSSTWLDKGGGIINTLIAWGLILVLELPFVLAYKRAVPMFPKAEGELSYASAAFGVKIGYWAGWMGIVVNLIVCGYEVIALARMVDFLWPGVQAHPFYEVQGYPVGPYMILIGLALVVGIFILHYRGVSLSSTFQRITSTTLMILVAIGVIIAFFFADFNNFKPYFGKPMWQGVIAVVVLLPFSLAGWESIAKGAEEASDSSTSGKAVPVAWGTGWSAYILTLVATALVIPWEAAAKEDIPFATGLNEATGSELPGILLIVTAIIGVVGVYNALFFAATRQLFGMARAGMMPAWLADVHPKYKTPYKAIIFVSAFVLITPFLGKNVLLPFVDAASFSYAVLWGGTFLSIFVLYRRYKGTKKAFPLPGGPIVAGLGFISVVFIIGALLIPGSPGALIWPLEYIVLAVLIGIGGILYFTGRKRHKAIDDEPEFPTEDKRFADDAATKEETHS